MIVDFAGVNCSRCLRNKLGASYCLAITVGCIVEGNLDALVAAQVCGVLVSGIEIDV